MSAAVLSLAALCVTGTLQAQVHYSFDCTDYVSTDNNRAPQSAFSYDKDKNTITINGNAGNNNIAFQMSSDKNGKYFINQDEEWFVVEGSNLRGNSGSDAYIWWFNGFNQNGQCPAEKIVDNGDTRLFIWNVRTNDMLNGNMPFSSKRITISSGGAQIVHAMGFTAETGRKATICNINHYSLYDLVSKYPAALEALGYTEESLTAEVRVQLSEMVAEAKALSPKEGSELAALVQKAEAELADMNGYAAALQLVKDLKEGIRQYKKEYAEVSYEATADGILARFNEQYIRISFFNDEVVRVSKTFNTDVLNKKSMSVIETPQSAPKFTLKEKDGIVSLIGSKVRLDYNLKRSTLSVVRLSDGQTLISEREAADFEPRKDGPFDTYTVTNSFRLADDEYIFGMGQIQDGNLNLRGKSYHLEIASLKVVIPYFQSSKHYALYWDNYSPTEFSDNNLGTTFSSTADEIDYYVLVGEDADDVLAIERRLTGKSPMPALWNFGLYQSRQRYKSTDEVMEVVRKYRELQVPLDCIVQDWQYWGDDYHWNAMEFLNPTYANYQEMIDHAHDNNVKFMISIWSNFGPQTKPFKEMQQKGHLLTGNSYPFGAGVRPYDPWSEEARDIYWRYLYDGIASKGIDAYWMDSTEPDYQPLNGDADFDCVTGSGKTWRSMRNSFPLAAVGGVHDHHRAVEAEGNNPLAGKRVSILTRSAFLGQQRYGANTWSSDIVAGWNTLAIQIPAALNFSACGIPYWNSDTGAFFGGNTQNAGWRRLFMRWAQFSCFCPMMRIHGDNNWREIYQFGSAGDGIGDYDQLYKYIRLRYRLLPYLYSTAWQVSVNDRTFMQALPLAFADDRQGYDVKDQYMFGDAFLVAPVVTDNTTSRSVYLPADHKWTDFWTGKIYDGGQTITKTAAIDIMPLYVKAGSIMPWGPDVQYSTEKPWDDLEIRVYPGADGTFTLYEDENDNYNYEKGHHSEIQFTWDDDAQTLTISDRKGEFVGMLKSRTFRFVKVSEKRGIGDLHSTLISATVTYDGKEMKVVLDGKDEAEEVVKLTDITDEYIVNPGFEADGRTLTKVAPQGWTVESQTAWWGVNRGGGEGDPQATDGEFIFGVWDGSNTLAPSIFQDIALPEGSYILTVDMHASNRINSIRVGNQRLFAGEAAARFADQITIAGTSDNYPMQTISLEFEATEDTSPLRIGVTTDGAPADTWFKIDNFRLYTADPNHPSVGINDVNSESDLQHVQGVFSLQGVKVANTLNDLKSLPRGIYVVDGKKYIKMMR